MRINIAASHRFHLLDLARELECQGHDVCFYSYVPTNRAVKFGLKKENCISLFYLILPIIVIEKFFKTLSFTTKIKFNILDYYLAFFMKPCDVYIALGTVYVKSFEMAKKKYNAKTIVEWGSKHIIEQEKAILDGTNAKRVPRYFINRSLKAYELVDFISVPSRHVKDTFLLHNFSEKKIILNPYGVDLSMFRPTTLDNADTFDVIMVGNWSLTKGCDLIIESLSNTNIKFLHVGSIKDLKFPDFPNMKHVDAVDQTELIKYYSRAKIFLLPSRAEGLALVQAQAIACGLPIVCSKDTGGEDLQSLISDKRWILLLNKTDEVNIRHNVNEALQLANTQKGVRNYAGEDIHSLTWKAYGERYNNNLNCICL